MSHALPASLAFIMFSLGIGLTIRDFARVVRVPRAVMTGMVCQILLLPVIAFGLIQLVTLPNEIKLGIMILAFCPGGVTSNVLSRLAGGAVALSVTLTGVISLLSVVTIPFLVTWASGYFLGQEAVSVDMYGIAQSMILITAAPVSLGVVLRHFFPEPIKILEPYILRISVVIFAIIVTLSIIANWETIQVEFPKLGPLIFGLNVLLLFTGWFVARAIGLDRRDRITLAIETGVQNAALGIAIATILTQGRPDLLAITLPAGAYGLTLYLVTLPFILWVRWSGGQVMREPSH